jgi:hypothetical protein
MEFTTKLFNRKWGMMSINTDLWDFSRKSFSLILSHKIMRGALELCWFHVYSTCSYAKEK